jgi:hypothetical protein
MNAADADDALTEAIGYRDEALRILEQAQAGVEHAESAMYVARSNRDSAERHLEAMEKWVASRERVLRELTIANDGGYQPEGSAT